MELQQYEYSALTEIHGWSEVPASQPLFESILVFENYPVDVSLASTLAQEQPGSLDIEDFVGLSKTNLALTVVASLTKVLTLQIAYDGQRFDRPAVERMLAQLRTILEGMALGLEQPLGSIPILPTQERDQLLVAWNDTARDFPGLEYSRDRCAHQLFEEQVRCTPDAIAVTFEGHSLTYAELNARANQLAHYLRAKGVGPEVMVGQCMEHSWEVVVGLLGIMKAGGAYVPLDPNYPAERLAFMLQDSGVSWLLTQERLVGRLPESAAHVIRVDTEWEEIARDGSDKDLVTEIGPDSLAYVIYTSGSTGRPKGALLQHRGLCNFEQAQCHDFLVDKHSRVLQFASLGFDASVGEIFMALLSGATLCMAPRETLVSIPDLVQFIRAQKVSVATLPPSLLALLPTEGLGVLKTVVSVGEACPPGVAARWSVGRRFMNGYGPTEATIGSVWGVVSELPEGASTVPIGRPIANALAYVLDERLSPVPIGVPGELHIGGVGLARGYLNRDDLTGKVRPRSLAGLGTSG